MMPEPTPPPRDDLTMLRAALAYAERGLHVFPCYEIADDGDCTCPPKHDSRDELGRCGAPGKHPRTRHGCLDATTDAAQIKRWWGRAPRANIAIAAGRSGWVVLDVDPRNGGDDRLRALEAEHGELAETVRALTGGGGVHYVYARPDLPHVRGPRNGLAIGIDVKADGGYIIVEPSNHVSGKSYAWDLSAHLDDTPIAPLPGWVRARLDQREKAFTPSQHAVTDGFLGAAFQAAGWLGRPLGPAHAAVRCPWNDDHTTGSLFNSSTVVYAPQRRGGRGWFDCRHGHCQGRSQDEVIAALPAEARAAARAQLGLGADAPQEAPWPEPDVAETPPPDCEEEAEGFGPEPPDTTGAPDWTSSLRWQNFKKRLLTKDVGNAALLLANDDEWAGVLEYDDFADEVRFVRPPPPIVGMVAPPVGTPVRDHHWPYVQHWLAKRHKLSLGQGPVASALIAAAHRNTVHPLRAYLDGLQWDQTPRLGTWLTTYLGVAETPYSTAVGCWWMVSAVARAIRPGCQADHLLILEGPQGLGKSKAVRTLANGWVLGHLPDLRTKDAQIMLQGVWLVEIDELDAFKGSGGTRIKSFVTQTQDTYRPPYGRTAITRGRGCVFVGTTNEATYLHDATGARRFWPVRCTRIDHDALLRDRDQLWAEARVTFDEGAPWWPSAAMHETIAAEQEERFEIDEWETRIGDFVAGRPTAGVTTGEALEYLGLKPHEWGRAEQMRVATALRRLGWDRPKDGRRRPDGARVWVPANTPIASAGNST